MTFGFDFEWSLEWFGISITYLPTYLPIRDWDLIYVALGATAEILRRPVIPECRPGFVAGGEYSVMSVGVSSDAHIVYAYYARSSFNLSNVVLIIVILEELD